MSEKDQELFWLQKSIRDLLVVYVENCSDEDAVFLRGELRALQYGLDRLLPWKEWDHKLSLGLSRYTTRLARERRAQEALEPGML